MGGRQLRILAACVLLSTWGVSDPADAAEARSPAVPKESAASARSRDDARALAATIDRLLAARWAEANVKPAPPADDAEYLRRVSLDLIGKIPTAAEARDFLDDRDPDKRARLVERLLESPTYLVRATEIWRSLLLPEADTDAQVRFLAPTFEAWLRKRVAEDVGYDKLVREVLTMKFGSRGRRAGSVYDRREEPTPLAFYAAKGGKPENLAAGTARVFLGVRLECAQCHNHPFARWKREEFWGLAAFFAGVAKQGPADGFGAIRELPNRRELPIPGTDRIVRAAFLGAAGPKWGPRSEGRTLLADWITAPENPYFARAAVNRVWARFFGLGIVEPADDMGEENPPSHPELLDELARQFREHRYDLKFLIRAVTGSRAYGVTSAVGRSELASPTLFAAMPVRGLSPGQLFDSLVQATGIRDRQAPRAGLDDDSSAKARFAELFADRDEKATESQTSILQALALMNGGLVAGATTLESGDTLAAIAEAPYLDTPGRIEALYLAALTREPRPDERKRLIAYVDSGGPAHDPAKALADVFWALLNTPEFKFNH